MIRLKSMFVLMGGDINRLQSESLFERYYRGSNDEQMGLRRKEKHKSRRSVGQPSRMSDKMINLRYQLEDLRMICDLVKRREKNKQKLLDCQKRSFRGKLGIAGGEWLG